MTERSKIAQRLTFVCSAVLMLQSPIFGQAAQVQVIQVGQNAPPIAVRSLAELDSLVAPIALYPDPLLTQVLVAATYPLEIVEAMQWLRQNPALAGAPLQEAAKQQDWDPSVQALALFPDVLHQLSENIQWTTDLGNAFLAQQAAVMDSIQRMRSRAVSSGTLSSNAQTVVTTQPQGPTTIVEIQPANPQVIYVPVYDPLTIWGPPSLYSYPVLYSPRRPVFVNPGLISFPSAIFVGSAFNGWNGWDGWGWRPNWFGRTVIVNNNFFHRYGYNRIGVARSYRVDGPSIWRHDPGRFRNDGRNNRRTIQAGRPVAAVPRVVTGAAPPPPRSAFPGVAPRVVPRSRQDDRPPTKTWTANPSPAPAPDSPRRRIAREIGSAAPAPEVSRPGRDVPRGNGRAVDQAPEGSRGEGRRSDEGASRSHDRGDRRRPLGR